MPCGAGAGCRRRICRAQWGPRAPPCAWRARGASAPAGSAPRCHLKRRRGPPNATPHVSVLNGRIHALRRRRPAAGRRRRCPAPRRAPRRAPRLGSSGRKGGAERNKRTKEVRAGAAVSAQPGARPDTPQGGARAGVSEWRATHVEGRKNASGAARAEGSTARTQLHRKEEAPGKGKRPRGAPHAQEHAPTRNNRQQTSSEKNPNPPASRGGAMRSTTSTRGEAPAACASR